VTKVCFFNWFFAVLTGRDRVQLRPVWTGLTTGVQPVATGFGRSGPVMSQIAKTSNRSSLGPSEYRPKNRTEPDLRTLPSTTTSSRVESREPPSSISASSKRRREDDESEVDQSSTGEEIMGTMASRERKRAKRRPSGIVGQGAWDVPAVHLSNILQ
jgi:hypothetical protein